jgi:hypothetical protein
MLRRRRYDGDIAMHNRPDGGLPIKVYQAFAVLIALGALASVLSLRMLPN